MTTPEAPEISLVIPVYDEAESLPILAAEIAEALAGRDHEVIFVDDGSRDGSLEVLRRLRREDRRRRVLHLERNSGQSAAFDAGFRAARAPIVVTLDADLQNDPADIPRLVAALAGCDMVSGVRVERRDRWSRRVASRIANRVRNAVVHDSVTDVGCSLKAYRAAVVRRLKMFDGLHRFLPALVEMQGGRVEEIPVRHRPRLHGASKYTIGRRLRRSLVDMAAVRWMQSRWIDEGRVEEID
ncbi:MAG TPA: glycosyltransferase family 2 protein [Thermoanaerobaculia bacterium]|jgi:glycosyltransferase involved in cell wall biosynthesis